MITPKRLKKGDTIAIVAPAGKIKKEIVDNAVKILKNWGLRVVPGKNLFKNHYQFAATDANRTSDFQQMLDDNSVKAIICARGGYGVIRIIDKLDFTNFIKNPKWIIGFSDITIFHSHINSKYGIETIHATMAAGLNDKESANTLKKSIFGENLFYEFETLPLSKTGTGEGVLTGGNLAILCSLIGSESNIDYSGKVLFIEEVGEYLYRFDRTIWQLKRAGKLNKLAGLIVGGITDMQDNDSPYGKTAHEIILEVVKEFDYPLFFGFPAGHQDDNKALIMGRKVKLEVGDKASIKFG